MQRLCDIAIKTQDQRALIGLERRRSLGLGGADYRMTAIPITQDIACVSTKAIGRLIEPN
jgi:hypothetical protein